MEEKDKQFTIFILRFSITHTVTYIIFGMFFMMASNYFDVFAQDPLFSVVMKSFESLSVRLAPLLQLVRGGLLATAIYPFRTVILKKKYGWLKLFWLMYVLTSIGAVIIGPGSIEGFLYTNFSCSPLIGVPEITFQLLVFSWLFVRWETKHSLN